jgi:hypothetical protein
MRFVLRVFGIPVLSAELEPPELDDEEDEEDIDGLRLTTTDHSFGFAPDPVFTPLYDDDEERLDDEDE